MWFKVFSKIWLHYNIITLALCLCQGSRGWDHGNRSVFGTSRFFCDKHFMFSFFSYGRHHGSKQRKCQEPITGSFYINLWTCCEIRSDPIFLSILVLEHDMEWEEMTVFAENTEKTKFSSWDWVFAPASSSVTLHWSKVTFLLALPGVILPLHRWILWIRDWREKIQYATIWTQLDKLMANTCWQQLASK